MEQNILEQIGLTAGETKVYLALLELGSTTTGPIVDKSGISASKVYDILDRLSKKGLVSHIIKENIKYFRAANPHRIIDYLNEKEKEIINKKEQIKKILPELLLKQKLAEVKQEAEIYEGIKGIKTARENLLKTLKKGDTLLILGAPVEANIKLEPWLLDFHKRREASGIEMKILYNMNARKYGKIREKWKLTEVKYMEQDVITPTWIEIYNDITAFFLLTEAPVAFVVKSKAISDSFREYFDLLWKREIKVYVGIEGLKMAHEKTLEVLKEGDTFYFLGASVASSEKLRAYWQDYHKRRQEKQINARILFNKDVPQKELDNRNSFKYCKARHMPIPIKTPVWIEVIGDLTTIGIPTEEPQSIEINNKEVAEGFKDYFNAFWKMTKKH